MSESKHTPGPWALGGWEDHLGYDCMTGGVKVGPLYLDGGDYGQRACQPIQPVDKDRLLADARLIAAAPDLLAGAIAAESETPGDEFERRNEHGVFVWMTWETIEALRAAIARAEGR